jgi:hypothetical protein
MIRSPLLAGFGHAFATKSDDESAIAGAIGIGPDRLFRAKQVHGTNVLGLHGSVRPPDALAIEADALVADDPGDGVAVVTADCVPILLADPGSGRVAAVHAGWRGTESGVLPAALAALASAGSPSPGLVAVIGPHIRVCCFEVGLDVAERLAAVGARIERPGKTPHASLAAALAHQLSAAGVTAIDDVGGCTKHEALRFHSYRRDGKGAGRQISAIAVHPGGA